jgi:molybdopterin-binding protein
MKISARNQLRGTVETVDLGVVTAKVGVRVGENLIESVITKQSVEDLLVAVREGAILAGPQGPLWHWLLERKHHQAGRLARQRLDLRELPLQGKVQKRIVRAATRGLPKWPHFSLPPTR